MNITPLDKSKQEITAYIVDNNIALAFALLAPHIADAHMWSAEERYDELRLRFKQILTFDIEGVVDDQRDTQLDTLRNDLLDLTCAVIEHISITQTDDYLYKKMRTYNLRGRNNAVDWASALATPEGEGAYSDEYCHMMDLMYDEILLTEEVTTSDRERWAAVTTSTATSTTAQLIAISALTLRLVRRYDRKLLKMLADRVATMAGQAQARTLIGIIFVYVAHSKQIALDKNMTDVLKDLFHDTSLADTINQTFKHIFKTYDTDAITRRIKDEIYPEMIKSGIKMRRMIQDSAEDIDLDESGTPKWTNTAEDKEMMDKLQMFSDMQENGDDVFLSTFAEMKHFSFFNEMSHWFMPFDSRMPDMASILSSTSEILSVFTQNNQMCHSDKYSYLYTIGQLPADNIKMIMDQINDNDIRHLREEMRGETWKEFVAANQLKAETKNYAQDLFRFYRLYPQSDSFVNSLEAVKTIGMCNNFYRIFTPDTIRQIGNMLIDKSYYSQGIELYSHLDEIKVWDHTFYQQSGYCYERLGRWHEALEAYEKADLIMPDDIWTLQHKALCRKKTAQWDGAIECYSAILKQKPDDVNTIVKIANCYTAMGDYSHARALYFKADYLEPNKIKVQRLLAWCMYLDKCYDDALKVYHNILSSDSCTEEDILNSGHVYLALGDKKGALRQYIGARKKINDSSRFAVLFLADKEQLADAGLNTADIMLILNQAEILDEEDIMQNKPTIQ